MLTPPFDECLIIGGFITNLPVNLWHVIVEPAIVHPQKDVGIEVVVVLGTIGVTAYRRTFFVTVNTKWRDAHLHPGLGLVDGLIELLDEEVDIISAPVVDVPDAVGVLTEEVFVGDNLALHGIGIEIVVHVDAVDIITAHDVTRHLTDVITVLWESGIEDEEIVVAETAEGLAYCDMVGCELLGGLRLCTIWVDPCVEFHTTAMTLCNHPLQGVPVRRGCHTLLACQETAPWLELTLIEGVTFGAHLEDDDVTTVFLEFVELIREGLLHLLGAKALKLTVDTLNPGTAELTLGLGDKGGRNKK